MCKIFNLCVEDDNDSAPLQFPDADDDLFQALKNYKGFDFLNDDMQTNMDEKPSSSSQPSNVDDAELLGPLDDLDKLCMSQSGKDMLDLINEPSIQMAESYPKELVPKQECVEDSILTPPIEGKAKAKTIAQKRKRRKYKTPEEILQQQERLRCRRKDAAKRSRERKADYIQQLEKDNQALQDKIYFLEQQLASIYQSAQACERS